MPSTRDPHPVCAVAPAARRRPTAVALAVGLVVASVHLWLVNGWARRPIVPDVVAAPAPAPVLALAAPALPAAAAPPQAKSPGPGTAPPPSAAPARPLALPARPASPPTPTAARPVAPRDAGPTLAGADTASAPPALVVAAPPRPIAQPTAHLTPPPVHLRYRVRRGLLSGSGTLDWQPEASGYRMTLEARVPMVGAILRETSTGSLDATGVAPRRHTEWRLRRSERAVSFVRDDGRPRILFSAREGEAPLTPGAQDRLSWIAQLAARLAAPPAGDWHDGSQIAMDVAGVGGDVQRWVFTLLDRAADGLWHLRRDPEEPTDTRAEVWVDPRLHHWPVRIRLAETHGEPLELELDGIDPPPAASSP